MPLTHIIISFSLFCLTILLQKSWNARIELQHTTLNISWRWAILAELACWMTSAASVTGVKPAILDQLWYFTAILILCPFISVLGARSPTHRVWSWFIIFPLIAVLGWPAWTLLFERSDLPRLVIQVPVTIGFFLVLIMGIGNYIGTRFGAPAFWIGVSVMCIVCSCTSIGFENPQRIDQLRAMGSFFFVFGIWTAFRQASRPTLEESRFDRLWFDFRDTFGIVWSIRIQERLNETAESEKWLSRLGPDGFYWQKLLETDDASLEKRKQETEVKMEHTLRWLLRRFVEPQFIDERLKV